MKLKHQLRGQNVERDVNNTIPLGFFISNKIGGLLYFDAKNDCTKYYARINGSTFKILDDINIDGKLTCVNNKFHSIEMIRDEHGHEIFIPYYMNAFTLTSKMEAPVQLILNPKDVQKGTVSKSNTVYEKQGRIVIKSQIPGMISDNFLYIVFQGDDIKYDSKQGAEPGQVEIEIMAPRVTISVGCNEDYAVKAADHLYHNEKQMKDIQENYISSFTSFNDPEAAMAYACVLNGTDHMFLPDTGRESNAMTPVPFFSEVSSPHTVIAAHALLTEGEFGIVKKTLFKELEIQRQRMRSGQASFEEVAWTIFLFGKMLNHLCTHEKLYDYFTPQDVKDSALKIISLVDMISEKYLQDDGTVSTEYGKTLESQSLLLSIYNFAYALTKKDNYQKSEEVLREPVRKILFDHKIFSDPAYKELKKEDVGSILLAAYTYSVLLSTEEWKQCFDNILDKVSNNFQTLQSKMVCEDIDGAIKLEHFALTSLAAIVFSKTDPEKYEKQVNVLIRSAVSEVLYKGVIGRPTSAFKLADNPESETMITDSHLMNNALFLEMIRECS